MKKISVLCASPRNFNPGMFSVDIAFHNLMKNYDVAAEINYYVLAYPSDESFLAQLPFKYKLAQDNLNDIHNSDAIIFWGDFLLSQHYHLVLKRRLVEKGYAKNPNDAQKIINECLLLLSAPTGILEKCFVFGSSQLLDFNNALADEVYVKALNELVERAQGVWMRDIYSALKIARIRKEAVDKCHGVDASLLPTASNNIEKNDKLLSGKRKVVGVFLKRTKIDAKASLSFADGLCNNLGFGAEWIPWFHPAERRYRRDFKKYFPSLNYKNDEPEVYPLLSSLKDYQLIITDTYHLCLNSWSSGTPAICITNGNEFNPSTLSDKKKEVFYLTNEAQDFLVDIDTLNLFKVNRYLLSSKEKAVKKLTIERFKELVLKEELSNSVISNIQSHAAAVEKDFVCRLKKLIS